MKRFAHIEYLTGDTDVIEADYAVKQPDSKIVTFYLKNDNSNPEVVAMYNMDNIIGWGFDDEGELGDEINDNYSIYIDGIKDCWNFFKNMLQDTISVPKIRSELKCFFKNNDPIITIMNFCIDEEEDDED